MWRAARDDEDERIVRMSLALYAEDPSDRPVGPEQIRRTLSVLRREPSRGRAVVAEVDGGVVGYALLVSYWSNELGGEICTVDELWIDPSVRGRKIGSRLFDAILEDRALWPVPPVALELEVTPDNARARALYERLAFTLKKNATLRRRQA